MVYQFGLRLAERFKSGGPSLGRSPGAHKQRRPVNQDQIKFFGEIGSTQFSEQGLRPALFFSRFFSRCSVSKYSEKKPVAAICAQRSGHANQSDPAQF